MGVTFVSRYSLEVLSAQSEQFRFIHKGKMCLRADKNIYIFLYSLLARFFFGTFESSFKGRRRSYTPVSTGCSTLD